MNLQIAHTHLTVTLIFYTFDDRKIWREIADALNYAFRTTKHWGGLRSNLTIRIFPSHRALEDAVNVKYPWLRAWAMYDEIYLQSPRTWWSGNYRDALSELLAHELTHVLMYQMCCHKADWHKRDIPFWFVEGMASVTARQGYRRWPKAKLSKFLQTPHGRNIWLRPENNLQHDQAASYSLAHWMFVRLLQNGGPAKVRQLLEQLQRVSTFTVAFFLTYGQTTNQFITQFAKAFIS
jgi:hypothetical protein